jgi:hypothetical protein
VSGHRVVTLIEIASPADKAAAALSSGLHITVLDLIPPGRHDPHGLHGAIWERFDLEPYVPPPGSPVIAVSYERFMYRKADPGAEVMMRI